LPLAQAGLDVMPGCPGPLALALEDLRPSHHVPMLFPIRPRTSAERVRSEQMEG